jgi:hypothetical protein
MPGIYFCNSTVSLLVQNSTPLELWATHLDLSHRVALPLGQAGVNNLKACLVNFSNQGQAPPNF